MRGDGIFLVARKAGPVKDRFPSKLYQPRQAFDPALLVG